MLANFDSVAPLKPCVLAILVKGQREVTMTFQLGPCYCGLCEIVSDGSNVRNIYEALSIYFL